MRDLASLPRSSLIVLISVVKYSCIFLLTVCIMGSDSTMDDIRSPTDATPLPVTSLAFCAILEGVVITSPAASVKAFSENPLATDGATLPRPLPSSLAPPAPIPPVAMSPAICAYKGESSNCSDIACIRCSGVRSCPTYPSPL